MKFRYQTFYDVQTSKDSMQVLQWSVGGAEVIQRCSHLFAAYKYFKLGKVSVKFQPISTLPVDPQGLSYDVDDPLTVDPRDQANLGLVRITNGEDIFTDVSRLSAQQQEHAYYSMMLDPRWSKFSLQSGFRRSAYPLYWQIGQLNQDYYPGATVNIPMGNSDDTGYNLLGKTVAAHLYSKSANNVIDLARVASDVAVSSPRGLFQVGHRGRLGFLPTDFYQQILAGSTTGFEDYGANNVPEVSVITAILPKAFKTVYYYRVYVTEEVIFSGIRSSPPVFGVDGSFIRNNGFDQFIQGNFGRVIPTSEQNITLTLPNNNHMNNGDDLP